MKNKSRALLYVQFKMKPGQKPPTIIIDRERFEVHIDGNLVNLSSVQFDLFNMICAADGRVVSRQDMMRKIWGSPKNILNTIESRTIDQHISRLRRALSSRPLIQTVPGRGYKLIRY